MGFGGRQVQDELIAAGLLCFALRMYTAEDGIKRLTGRAPWLLQMLSCVADVGLIRCLEDLVGSTAKR